MATLDLSSLLTQIQQGQGYSEQGYTGTTGSENTTQFVNSAWDIANSVNDVQNCENNVEQDAAVQNIIQSLTQKLSSFINNNGASEEADRRSKDNEQQIDNNATLAAETHQTLNEQLQTIIDQATSNGEAIQTALDKIKELGGENGDNGGKVAEAKQKLDEQLEKIENNKQILNNPDAKAEDRKKALGEILSAASSINELVVQIGEFNQIIEEQNDIIKTNQESIESISQEGAQILSEGMSELQQIDQKNAQLKQEQPKIASDGNAANQEGDALQQAAMEAEATPAGSVAAQELEAKAQDYHTAGQTLEQGATDGVTNLAQSDNKLGTYKQDLSNCQTRLGEYAQNATNLVGEYNNLVDPMIKAIGSWDDVSAANEELQEYVEDYTQQMVTANGAAVSESKKDSSKTQFNQPQQVQTPQQNESSNSPVGDIIQNAFAPVAAAQNSNGTEAASANNPFDDINAEQMNFVEFTFDTKKFSQKQS